MARRGVSGLDCVWSEGVGLRRGVRQCGCRWGADWGGQLRERVSSVG